MNVAYLKVTYGLRFHLFFSAPDCWCLFTGIVVHQLCSSAFSSKHEARVVAGAGMARHIFYFWATGMVQSWCPTQTAYSAYRERRYWFYRPRYRSYRTDRTARALSVRPQRGRGSSLTEFLLHNQTALYRKSISNILYWIFHIIMATSKIIYFFKPVMCWKQLCLLNIFLWKLWYFFQNLSWIESKINMIIIIIIIQFTKELLINRFIVHFPHFFCWVHAICITSLLVNMCTKSFRRVWKRPYL